MQTIEKEQAKILFCSEDIARGDLILVNGQHPLAESVEREMHEHMARLQPGDAARQRALGEGARIERDVWLHASAAAAYEALLCACQGAQEIIAVSGARTMRQQQEIYASCVREQGVAYAAAYVAQPGCSEHQCALAVDVAARRPRIDYVCPEFPDEGACGRFAALAADYGFVRRYTEHKQAITGIAAEPWHFRYVGLPHSRLMQSMDLCLEQYHRWIRTYSQQAPYICEVDGKRAALFYCGVEEGQSTPLYLQEGWRYHVSGNNIDGMVVLAVEEKTGKKRTRERDLQKGKPVREQRKDMRRANSMDGQAGQAQPMCATDAKIRCVPVPKCLGSGKRLRAMDYARAWIQLDGEALAHNVGQLRRKLPRGCTLGAVLKANAYGHGLLPMARALSELGVNLFMVSDRWEALQLRQDGIAGDILVLGYTHPQQLSDVSQADCIQTVLDAEYARAMDATGIQMRAHVAMDTGMRRLGERSLQTLAQCYAHKNIAVEGTFTHLCRSDSLSPRDVEFTKAQIQTFQHNVQALRTRGIRPGKLHVQASHGVYNYAQCRYDVARVGVGIYGLMDAGRCKTPMNLRPVLSLYTRVAVVKRLKRGEGLGYGHQFVAQRDSRIAVVAIGFSDGIPRGYRRDCLVRGQRAPIVGALCMQQIFLDVTDIPGVAAGDVVTCIGRDGDQCVRALDISDACDTVVAEVLSRLPPHMQRIWFGVKTQERATL